MNKICFIATIPTTLESFVIKTASYLHDNTDWKISIITSYDESFAKSLPEYIDYYPVKMDRGINITVFIAVIKMLKIFRRERFELIQYSTPNASLCASIAGAIANIPVRLYCQWGMVYVGFSGIKRQVFKLEEKLVCYLSTWIEPDSKSNLDFSHSEGLYKQEKGSVVWNGSACGVDIEKFDASKKIEYRRAIRDRFCIPKTDFVFGFVGRITRDKGINELLAAFKDLSSNKRDVRLMLVGRKELDSTIDSELIEWATTSDKIYFTGYTNEVEQYLSAMDVYILPSYREGFGMGVVEAEAMGVPVIVSNIPGPIDGMLNNKTGLVIPKKDTKALKEAMEELYASPDMCQEFGKNGIELAKNSFEQKELFRRILDDRKKLLSEIKRNSR